MKASVCMIAYNHEKYIVPAVESALMQQTDFDYEIVVGEDCSTDKTRALLIDLQKRHPGKIRLLLPETNLGMMPNFIQTLQACQGQYIALLEGDDYWTHPHKLQKQVNFLERNPDFALCFHKSKVIFEHGGTNEWLVHFNDNQQEVTRFEDLARGNYILTATCVFRNKLFGAFPDWFASLPAGDWPLHLLNARHGKIKFINEEMAIYRVHQAGAWSMTDSRKNLYKNLVMLEKLTDHFGQRYRHLFAEQLKYHYRESLLYQYSVREQRKFLKLYLGNLQMNPGEFPKRKWIYMLIDMYFPALIKMYKKLKN